MSCRGEHIPWCDPRIVSATDPRAVLRSFYGDQSAALDMEAWADDDRDALAASILAEVGAQMTEESYPPLSADRVMITDITRDDDAGADARFERAVSVYTAAKATEEVGRLAVVAAEQGYRLDAYERAERAYCIAQDARAEAYYVMEDARAA